MALILHLGVVDIPYAKGGKTTGEVAEILESKFGVMQGFFDKNEGAISEAVENSLAGALETLFIGGEVKDPFAAGMSKVETRFREYITNQEHGMHLKKMDAPKVGPRFKRQYRKARKGTIAFYETGLYRKSFKAWITNG